MLRELSDRASVDAHVRTYDFDDVEMREESSGTLVFEGVASVVDKPYTVRDTVGEYEETIQRGAFDKTLAELQKRSAKSDFALFVNHNHLYGAPPLATVSSGRLEVWADPHLRVRARLNPLRPSVQEARHAVDDGEMRQMSVGFNRVPSRDKWNEDYTAVTRTEVKAVEASIVWRGANPHTSGGMRGLNDLIAEFDDADLDESDLRRAIDALEKRLPAPEPVISTGPRPELLALWAKRPL